MVENEEIEVAGDMKFANVLHLKVNGSPITTQILSKDVMETTLLYKGSPFNISILPETGASYLKHMKEKPKLDLSSVVISPMPGAIKAVNVEVGQMVSEGQELCVIEAMKMQNSLNAGKTGKVKAVNCKVGSTVDKGEILIELE